MWICTNSAFLSIIAHKEHPSLMVVRARVKGHIEAVFPDASVMETPNSDYRYRASLARDYVAKVIAEKIEDIDYRNFKDSVKSKKLHDAYLGFWNIMYRLQDDLLPRTKRKMTSEAWPAR